MRVLIIGATGFVGKALTKYLSDIAGIHSTALVHKQEPGEQYNGISYVQKSLQQIDYQWLSGQQFDYIFHLARIPGKRWGDTGRYLAAKRGARANKKLLIAIEQLSKKPKLIYLSGSLMYGHIPGEKATEQNILNPAGFARQYIHAEEPILKAIKNGNNNIMMLRAPWILGDGSWFMQLYANYILQKKVVPAYGDKDRMMSIITVEDCAAIMWHYAYKAEYSRIYNIYTHQMQYSDFIRTIAAAYDCDKEQHYSATQMLNSMDKTTQNSILCEVVLDTTYPEILNNYQPVHSDLNKYLKQLAETTHA